MRGRGKGRIGEREGEERGCSINGCYYAEYKKKIGFSGQLYIEPKPKEPMKHQYDYGELV